MIMEYKHYEYWDVLLTLDKCNSPADTAALEYALCLRDVIQTLMCFDVEEHLCETEV